MSVTGWVADIQRYSLHDGPGIRTVIFLKSCPLSCVWCANPECQHSRPELLLTHTPCLACDACVQACPNGAITLETSPEDQTTPVIQWARCASNLACAAVCPTGTLTQVGDKYAIEEIIPIIERDRAFYERSNGGVTLSGGEPTVQADFSQGILEACRHLNIHTVVETCGACEWEDLIALSDLADLVYFDLKHLESSRHLEFTGMSNDQILDNLCRLGQQYEKLVVRLPMIPGFNDDEGHLADLAAYLISINPQIVLEVIPFHRFGAGKYVRMGRIYPYEAVASLEPELQRAHEQFLRAQGLKVL